MDDLSGLEQLIRLISHLRSLSDTLQEDNSRIRAAFSEIDLEFLDVGVALDYPEIGNCREDLDTSFLDFLEKSERLAEDLDTVRNRLMLAYHVRTQFSFPYAMAGMAIAAATVGPFVTAFCTELGKSLAAPPPTGLDE